MVPGDLQIVVVRIRRHLLVEASGLQPGGRNGEELLVLMPGICPADNHEGQEQHYADSRMILHMAMGERSR